MSLKRRQTVAAIGIAVLLQACSSARAQVDESGIRRGLEWLVAHQRKDGSWSFAHTTDACPRDCGPHGELAGDNLMATGVVLLAFLGAGQTHKEGKYKEPVTKGLAFLLKELKGGRDRLREEGSGELGRTIATLALSEAYAMTADKRLMKPAQTAIDHIIKTKDDKTHGWRMRKMERCSIEFTAWQLMALRSAHMAYLRVPLKEVQKVHAYLDSLQHDGGGTYGRDKPQPLATAAGLLSRSFLGWPEDDFNFEKREDERVKRGIKYLSELEPQPGQLEYNFFAHQVLFHNPDHEIWPKWNERLREHLIETQSTKGHTKGSWYFKNGDQRTKWGGRVYCTAMSLAILEIYYRHLPVFRARSTDPLGAK